MSGIWPGRPLAGKPGRFYVDPQTAKSFQLTKHFYLNEFLCPCCSSYSDFEHIDRLAKVLEEIRKIIREPIIINSASRCWEHNKKVGGAFDSAHLRDLAADIKIKDSHYRFKLISAALKVGITRLGIGDNFIHIDLDTRHVKPRQVVWVY